MPNSQFRSPFVIQPNQLRVKLTFSLFNNEEIVDHASIRFLVMQRDQAGHLISIPGNAEWKTGDPDKWHVDVNHPDVQHLDKTKKARAIGIAITLKPDEPNPPAFDTLTWCVGVDLQ